MRRALPTDTPTLLTLMGDFYAEAGYTLDRVLAEKAFAAVLSDEPKSGRCEFRFFPGDFVFSEIRLLRSSRNG